MKAIVQARYGEPRDVLELREIDAPRPLANEVLVRVFAASVHADVWHSICGRPILVRLMGAGLLKPKDPVPGSDLAGVVEAVGDAVTRFEVGDAVFGASWTKMQWRNGGTFAELAVAPEEALESKPERASFAQAASLPSSGYIALINMRGPAAIRSGMKMLINGAGGAVGSIALQVAKARGAWVTAVDRTERLDMLRDLGADRVVDFTKADVTEDGGRHDLIFDVASTLSLRRCKKVLNPEGIYVLIGHDHYGAAGGPILGTLPHFFGVLARSPFDRHLPSPSLERPPGIREVMTELRKLLEEGRLTPVIDRTFPLGQAREALSYLQSGGGAGRILVAPRQSENVDPAPIRGSEPPL